MENTAKTVESTVEPKTFPLFHVENSVDFYQVQKSTQKPHVENLVELHPRKIQKDVKD